MEKNHKKDIEQLLLKQTEKIFFEIDPAATVVFSKYIKPHCKELAKKFLKTQKKLKKQLEEIALTAPDSGKNTPKKEVVVLESKAKLPVKKSTPIQKNINTKTQVKTKTLAPAKQKRVRIGNNLSNAGVIQKKAKAALVKNINKSPKK
jgi:hypothetical protein